MSESLEHYKTITAEQAISEYDGLTDRMSITHQVLAWNNGVATHNPIRDECCPDFSCCGEPMWSDHERQVFTQAFLDGNDEVTDAMCNGALSTMVANALKKIRPDMGDVPVAIIGDPANTHEVQ